MTKQQLLDRARAAMILAMDALESDTNENAKCQAFEIIQSQFQAQYVSQREHAKAEKLVKKLKLEHKQWIRSGYNLWPK